MQGVTGVGAACAEQLDVEKAQLLFDSINICVAEMCRNQRFINTLECLSVNDEALQLDSIKDWLLKHIEY
jgi:hypothetical protein